MPPSQLKRLKASLHEKGILGPQKSKKQKKNQSKNGGDEFGRAKRHAALAEIREDFNPFDVKALSRPKKFEATTLNRSKSKSKDASGVVGRPGVTKSFGEETRRATLLPELNRRHKVGGINDRRFGENDPTLTPEERMMERFVREKQRGKGASIFDLEEAEDDEDGGLTHAGKALDFGDNIDAQDDFDPGSLDGSESSDEEGTKSRKRRLSVREDGENGERDEEEQPERKKSKAEVMKEVIAKSKFHKYERQQAKEDDEEEREKLDEDLPALLSILRSRQPPPKLTQQATPEDASMDPGRQALLAQTQLDAEKEFDKRVRDLARDKKAQPTERTKTEEEKAIAEALRLKNLEEKRLRRMRGEVESEEENEEPKKAKDGDDLDIDDDEDVLDDAEQFGITRKKQLPSNHGVEDEDDFLLDEDLIASGSDLESDQIESDDSDESEQEDGSHEDEDDEFIRGLLPTKQGGEESFGTKAESEVAKPTSSKLAYTYACPTSHSELLAVFKNVAVQDTPTVVQRIRALYHPQLSAENTAKLSAFSTALVEHIFYLGNQKPPAPLPVIETLIRHLHSLSRQFAEDIGQAFREKLGEMQRDEFPTPGDLILLTAIGTMYPTSDHFHQVVTPAITIMARWLGLTTPRTAQDLNSGAYIATLALQYQKFSKRYIPELINFCVKALESPALTPSHIKTYAHILTSAADLWSSKSAFTEIFSPAVVSALQRHKQKHALQRLQIHLTAARSARRPLELHHHRPVPIKSQIPKFEESFNPDKHYDPNRERAEASKLKAEYKKERKGALRELRKDANFIARTKLREKKEADAAYETKYKKLVASIQNEEGAEANQYDRIKRARKRNN